VLKVKVEELKKRNEEWATDLQALELGFDDTPSSNRNEDGSESASSGQSH
jgi:hypothetical protein